MKRGEMVLKGALIVWVEECEEKTDRKDGDDNGGREGEADRQKGVTPTHVTRRDPAEQLGCAFAAEAVHQTAQSR